MRPPLRLLLTVCVFSILWSTAGDPAPAPSAQPVTTTIQGLPPTEGRQILAADEAGNAYLLQVAEKRVLRVDESTGLVHLHSRLKSERPIGGVLRAAVGDEGRTWVFQLSPHSVRVFEDGAEVEIEQPGVVIDGVAVTRGRPTLTLGTARPVIGTDVGRDGPRPPTPPLAVQLDGDGEWQPWIERSDVDRRTRDEARALGILGNETRLAGDERGRLLMARRYVYEVREYQPNGKLSDRLDVGAVEMIPMPKETARKLEEMGRAFAPGRKRPKSLIEGVAWSPEGEVLILAKTEDGYALDRWIPSLQEHARLSLEELEHPPSPLQMASTRNGLLFLPAAGSTKLVYVPWEYLRSARWRSLEDEAPSGAG